MASGAGGMTPPVQWGIIGTGNIARKFAEGLRVLPDAKLTAIGSRSESNAKAFASKHDIPRCHSSYEALARDPDIEVVYVATPHPFHRENTILCLEHGKNVICEKPFAVNAVEAGEMIRCARNRKLFLMEAMWTRFFPAMEKVRALLAENAVGEARMLEASFGFRCNWNPESRLLKPLLAGGSLLDVGVYCVSFSSMLFGAPEQIAGLAHLGETGVDEQAAWVFLHGGGKLSLCSSAVRTSMPSEAVIVGTEGRILIQGPWWTPTKLTLHAKGREPAQMEYPLTGNGMNYEAEAVMRCLRQGRLEHGTMPLDETLTIMKTMDALRAQWGLSYPTETQ